MGKINLSKFTRPVERFVVKQAPEILLALGITGMFTMAGLAVAATPKVVKKIEKRKVELFEEDKLKYDDEKGELESLPVKDVVKLCWKDYIPAAITGAVSTVCLIGSRSIGARRQAALATAYKLSETALTEYRNKVVETVGEQKAKEIDNEVEKEQVKKHPVVDKEVIITGDGEVLCFDLISKRYFKTTADTIRRAENIINKRLMDEMWVSLNEFYWELGLDSVGTGDAFGWDIDKGFIDARIGTQLTDDDKPCLTLSFRNPPDYRY